MTCYSVTNIKNVTFSTILLTFHVHNVIHCRIIQHGIRTLKMWEWPGNEAEDSQDWWQKTQSTVYKWGKGSWNQLGTSMHENSSPALAEEWKEVQPFNKLLHIYGHSLQLSQRTVYLCTQDNINFDLVAQVVSSPLYYACASKNS